MENLVEHRFAGVAEGGVAEIVAERDGLHQILVEPQRPGDGATELGHLEGVGESGAGVIGGVRDKDLGLVLEPAKGPGVEDPVAIPLEGEPRARLRSVAGSPATASVDRTA